MNLDRAVLAFAGLVVLISGALGYVVSPYWFLLTAFAALNMLQSSFTGFCPRRDRLSAPRPQARRGVRLTQCTLR